MELNNNPQSNNMVLINNTFQLKIKSINPSRTERGNFRDVSISKSHIPALSDWLEEHDGEVISRKLVRKVNANDIERIGRYKETVVKSVGRSNNLNSFQLESTHQIQIVESNNLRLIDPSYNLIHFMPNFQITTFAGTKRPKGKSIQGHIVISSFNPENNSRIELTRKQFTIALSSACNDGESKRHLDSSEYEVLTINFQSHNPIPILQISFDPKYDYASFFRGKSQHTSPLQFEFENTLHYLIKFNVYLLKEMKNNNKSNNNNDVIIIHNNNYNKSNEKMNEKKEKEGSNKRTDRDNEVELVQKKQKLNHSV